MKRALQFALALLLLASCHRAVKRQKQEIRPVTFTILAGSELKDMEIMKPDIAAATGLDLQFTYSATLDAVERLAKGEHFDALWVSHGKYLAMNNSMKGRILAQEKTMLSPVVLGLKTSKARALGWDKQDPTWKEISEAAKAGKFTFGMTNPASSNSGLTATIGLAAALAQNPDALTEADLKNPQLADFFNAQSLTAGSSASLAQNYENDQSQADGIINYESVLLSLNARGKLTEPLTLVYPKEGIITADYPLMLLNGGKRTAYNKLVKYLRTKDVQTRISALTLRRPVNPDAVMAAVIPNRTLIELPFPGNSSLISTLLETFLANVRIPASSRYLLDLSSSMDGDRLADLKQAMPMLASHFQNREEVGIITFSSAPSPTVLFPMGATPAQNEQARAAAVEFVKPLTADGGTAIYDSVCQALTELADERALQKEKRQYTVVLITDGKNNHGLKRAEFIDWYNTQGERIRGIPVFPILFGEGNERALGAIASVTGGRLFDSRSTPLAVVFKEIRGYQ